MSRLVTTQKMKFSVKDFFSKYDQTRSFLRIWSYLLKKSLMENLTFCAVGAPSCYLELLDKLQKRICRTVVPSLTASIEPLAHH